MTLVAALAAASSPAAIVNWGDRYDPAGTVVFGDVTEDNGGPTTLFADEIDGPTAVGDSLRFSPQGFQAQASGMGSDLVDSTLRMTIGGAPVDAIVVNEWGDYSLGGLDGGQANASVGAAFFWRVLAVGGQSVALPVQTAQLTITDGGAYARPADDGTATPWAGSVLLDVASYLSAEQIEGEATLVELTLNNTLQVASDAVSNAFLKKKGVEVVVTTVAMPEPAGLALLGGAMAAIAAMRSRLG